jgi:hypothetical protein
MPRIGSGEAGGSWPVIKELIDEMITRKGLQATVYTIPQAGAQPTPPQLSLPFGEPE